ncbi:hypothetical protein GpSGHVEth003 [Glossina pallidipes salivary gland hypertrophy virus]|uniref:Uncharacterized protein n=2 Tax=Glossina hytrovirus (isolate Glossina pallidipes/Ethiopia/Seibersdorf/-) TaxID=379529 RepID=A0A0Y0K766_GHVS|nr:hypothetical protein SGHV003 [Glossina pallidipes salivary gland hypertrophy virus]ABQ08777.1 hypothetical protein SGHV003 [Glossina pallidipes salivary gland hypertrophy virus]AMB48607.1 hypothetical protein GpSGHVEth003 [Glossina pallidipes salivary gland hypertrophy virus]
MYLGIMERALDEDNGGILYKDKVCVFPYYNKAVGSFVEKKTMQNPINSAETLTAYVLRPQLENDNTYLECGFTNMYNTTKNELVKPPTIDCIETSKYKCMTREIDNISYMMLLNKNTNECSISNDMGIRVQTIIKIPKDILNNTFKKGYKLPSHLTETKYIRFKISAGSKYHIIVKNALEITQ